mmetsp:Transcript_1865/g.4226  ORF Transcript_1865/g.4226 Transcript_1865/m.4226 type:complete len:839 (-) Transcript_1865:89-2605(-)
MNNTSRYNEQAIQRLVDWNSDVMIRLLKQVVAKRTAYGQETWDVEPVLEQEEGKLVLDEVAEVIDLPMFKYYRTSPNPDSVVLPEAAEKQLRDYVAAVSNAYHDNPYHCLQHASQVTTALTKLLSRVVATSLDELDTELGEEYGEDDSLEDVQVTDNMAAMLHHHTFGIASDPLTQFGLVFAALIHAVDHQGLSNRDELKVSPEAAAPYGNRSMVEQRSINKAWKKLMEPEFKELRRCLYKDEVELKRFRQVVVNAVLATDIDDEELQNLRMTRWEKTFSSGVRMTGRDTLKDVNRKATIVLEQLMQAAHIIHTMQPWIVYDKWSRRHFLEMHVAFKGGNGTADPSASWLKSEMDFFDNYAIPLAMQLKDCDAFVVNQDEFLNYVLKNRQQLSSLGEDLLKSMIEQVKKDDLEEEQTDPASLVFNPEARMLDSLNSEGKVSKHLQHLIDWNVEILAMLVKRIVAKNNATGVSGNKEHINLELDPKVKIVDEVTDVIDFPDFDAATAPDLLNTSAELNVVIQSQLREFVTDIATRFKSNPFHCLDRGTQVCMSAKKLLGRLMTKTAAESSEDIYAKSFGVSCDPLAQLAVVFASLINDVDHQGIPNSQHVFESSYLADKFKNRCISEQHALDICWSHFMNGEFDELRASIFSSSGELKRFRQIVVNCILATDLEDDQLIHFRKKRWDKAFVAGRRDESLENRNRRATILLEMIAQSADTFHATQNWHLYTKWNERRFSEMYKVYQDKRLKQDPTIFWYKSELLFFDEHAIPLANQMKECACFGTTADEYLSWSLANRQQWAAKGNELVASIVARHLGKQIEKQRSVRFHRRVSLSAKQA